MHNGGNKNIDIFPCLLSFLLPCEKLGELFTCYYKYIYIFFVFSSVIDNKHGSIREKFCVCVCVCLFVSLLSFFLLDFLFFSSNDVTESVFFCIKTNTLSRKKNFLKNLVIV